MNSFKFLNDKDVQIIIFSILLLISFELIDSLKHLKKNYYRIFSIPPFYGYLVARLVFIILVTILMEAYFLNKFIQTSMLMHSLVMCFIATVIVLGIEKFSFRIYASDKKNLSTNGLKRHLQEARLSVYNAVKEKKKKIQEKYKNDFIREFMKKDIKFMVHLPISWQKPG